MNVDYDLRLSVRGEGPPVVLVPGMNGTGELFYNQVPLLERSYRVATYSLRDDADSMEALARDLSRVVEIVSPVERRAIVVGESFGGAIALTFGLTHPDRVAGLVILNSFCYFAPRLRLWLAIAALELFPGNAMPMVRYLTASRLHSRHTHRQEIERFIGLTANATRRGYLNRLKLLRRYDLRQRLGDIRAPTLFLASEWDHLVPAVSQARFMADSVPSSAMRILFGHGHICVIAPDFDLWQILDEWSAGKAIRC